MKRSTILVVSLLFRVALMFGVSLLLRAGRLDLWGLTVFSFLYGVLDASSGRSRRLLPGIVQKGNLSRANSIMLTTNQIGLVIGPMARGSVAAVLSYAQIFTLTGLTVALGAILLSLVRESASDRRRESRRIATSCASPFTMR